MRGRTGKLFAATAAMTLLCTGATAQTSVSEGLDCLIVPHVLTNLGSPINGILAEISVERGDFVNQGEVLGRLDSRVEVVSVELARARAESDFAIRSSRVRLAFRTRELDRIRELYKQKVATQKALEEADHELRLAEINLHEAQVNKLIARLELHRTEAALGEQRCGRPLGGPHRGTPGVRARRRSVCRTRRQ